MEKQIIKLRPKQLESLSKIQTQKAQLNQLFQDLNNNESLIIELILEESQIDPTEISNIKLEEGSLAFEIKDKEVKAKKKSVNTLK